MPSYLAFKECIRSTQTLSRALKNKDANGLKIVIEFYYKKTKIREVFQLVQSKESKFKINLTFAMDKD